ncbi:MAG TPA: dynamin family protein, partial [Limnochordia bacterium]|nr:dynamin family protein [Limnochordia bacterium]
AIPGQIESAIGRLDDTLTIAVMGEVKAGKSTLINALVGRAVAPTNVLEATAAVMEIVHGADAGALVHWRQQPAERLSVDECFALLERHRGDEGFFARCGSVEITLPFARLQNVRLVDTPGLGTVTAANEGVARNYVANADVILWVMSALHIGQSDIAEALEQVVRLGKPVVVAINRIDQVDASAERLAAYVRRSLPEEVEDVFAISAWAGFDAVARGDAYPEASGLDELVDLIRERFEGRDDAAKTDSARQVVAHQLAEELKIHRDYAKVMGEMDGRLAAHKAELEAHGRKIAGWLVTVIQIRVETEFMVEAYRRLKERPAKNQTELEEAIGRPYVERWWKDATDRLNERYAAQWRGAYESAGAEFNERMEAYIEGLATKLGPDGESASSGKFGQVMEGVGRGLTVGGSVGLGLAGYAAWLGPSAASMGIGSVVMAAIPPLLIVGVLGGAVFTVMNRIMAHSQRAEYEAHLLEHVERVRNQMRAIVNERLLPALNEHCDRTAAELHERFAAAMYGGMGAEACKAFFAAVEAHIQEGERLQAALG